MPYADDIPVKRTPHSSIPSNNFFSGTGMSMAYAGQGWYVPSDRSTIPVHNNYKIPPADRPDRIPIECEDDYVSFVRERDCVDGYYNRNIGTLPSGRPKYMMFGNKRDLPGMPTPEEYRQINPHNHSWLPTSRGPRGEYYGYYHEMLDFDRARHRRLMPMSDRIRPVDVPTICDNGRLNLYTNTCRGQLN